MLGLQAAIGALNDVVDAPRDAGRKVGKPIPARLVSVPAALTVAGVAAAGGVALSALSGPPTAGLAVVILAIGAAYDLRLKGTPWSWLPFAAGIPLLPVYGWLGATGSLPSSLIVLLPAGFIAGAALAIANALPDIERDRAAGATSIAAHLGRAVAWRVHLGLHATVVALAAGTLLAAGRVPLLVAAAAAVAALAILAGALLARSADRGRRERGWELEAVGVALLAAGWLAGTVAG